MRLSAFASDLNQDDLTQRREGAKKRKKRKRGPISRVLYAACAARRSFLYDDDCSPPLAAYPEVVTNRTDSAPCLALRRVGFTKPDESPRLLVRSYRTVSPLPLARRFTFCCTFPDLTTGGRYPPPCPATPGLSSRLTLASQTGDRPVLSYASNYRTRSPPRWRTTDEQSGRMSSADWKVLTRNNQKASVSEPRE